MTPAGVILKWILIPVICAAFGFYVIGAKIGRFIPSMGSKAVEVTPVTDSTTLTSNAGTSTQRFTAPDVQVTSRRKPRRHNP